MANRIYQKTFTRLEAITKATVALKAPGVSNDELAVVDGRLAQVVKTKGDLVTLQIFSGTEGIPTDAEVVFLGEPPTLKVSDDLAGRFFNAYGHPIDGGPEIEGEARQIGGPSVNPYKRRMPSQIIPTGIAGIDLNNTLVSGQKIPFFADADQPYNNVMAQVALRADVDKIILGGMGLSNDDYLYFKHEFESAGALDKIISFVCYSVVTIFAIAVIYPMLNLVSVSISTYRAYLLRPWMFFPTELDFTAFTTVFKSPQLMRSYGNTIFITVVGTFLTLGITALTAYPISRPQLRGKAIYMTIIIITMMISAGTIPNFLLIRDLGMYNTIWA
ncbi:MAG: hypothetical protein II276_00305, partial [Bacteroidales bacterium]|nr:hypothetical protein [Bacteroidales bacterium]